MGLGKKFRIGATQKPAPVEYPDIGSKILRDYDLYVDQWRNRMPLLAFDGYLALLESEQVCFTGMKKIGYHAFRDLYQDNQILPIEEGKNASDPGYLLIGKASQESNADGWYPTTNDRDRLVTATLAELDNADFLYSHCANFISYGTRGMNSPAKTLTLKPTNKESIPKAFVVFEIAFMKPYLEAQERAKTILESHISLPHNNSWRVPNTGKINHGPTL